uniref:Uncharacterized protein n=1 Tax=Panagrolaimus davidi TaxID=227884 RepID=A0A914PY26_9BILA
MIDIAEFYQVCEWAENQAIKNQNDENHNMNDAIKAKITPFLQFLNFSKMEPRFLNEYVFKKGYVFSYDECGNIMESIHGYVKVKITNSVGNSIYGFLQNNSAIEIIKTLKNRESDNPYINLIYWKTECNKPSTPCQLKMRAGVKWYLVYFYNGDIGVRNSFEIDHQEYMLAEMIAETDFKITKNCEIEIE